MAKVRRVFEIAKELGVDSKAIVAKCAAEGVPGIQNHMSTVKLGLEATIREWFSESHETATAVETAEKVDLAQVRRPARRRKAAVSMGAESQQVAVAEPEEEQATPLTEPQAAAPEAPEAAPAAPEAQVASAPVAEPVAPAPQAAAAAPQAEAPAAPVPTPVEPPRATPRGDVAPGAPAAPAAPAHARPGKATPHLPRQITPAGRPNVPDRPKVVSPAGQQLQKPQAAVLKGPKVIRIEQPEQFRAPRPRRPGPGGQGFQPAGGGAETGVPGIARSRGPVRGRGAGTGPAPETDQARPKRRSLSTRRGRSAEAVPVTGPTKFSEQDLIELDARLNRATGFLKQRRRDLRKSPGAGQTAASLAVTGGKVEIAEPITIKSLSAVTGIKSIDIIKYLFAKGIMATINSAIDAEAAMEVALEYNIELDVKAQQTAEQQVVQEFEQRPQIDVRARPPVVTVLGHVDHGKTSLLDRIRQADVAAHEAGGITQHVGAYRVTVKGADGQDKTVVFLDTPGHEAFTSMRARGASITDLVVLVVAADDGVMPQTIESINHAKAAGVPLIVALNKVDKAEATEANIRKIYGQLAEHGLNPVEWGGATEVVKVSAIQGTGISELLDVLDYQAELLELKADYGGPARGTVIESEMQPGRGPVARVLVEQGRIKVGDFIVIGRAFGRVRDMTDDRGKAIKEAGPATPLELSGIDVIPDAGDKFYVTLELQKAEEIALHYRETERQQQLASQTKVTLDNFAAQMQVGGMRELRIVLKADVQGSIDVLKKSLSEQGNQEVSVKVLHAAVGGITESDVLLADASDAIVVGFHVIAPAVVRDVAEQRGVDIRLYRIIYEIVDDVKKALEGLLEPEKREEQLGEAEVREVFRITKVGNIAGCVVLSGSVQRSGKIRVVRDGVVVTDGRDMQSLRRVKEDVREVRAGTECGVHIAGFDDVKPGDHLICYNTQTIKRTLS